MSFRVKCVPHYISGLVIFILLVAAALRLWDLPGVPPGPHYDEAANGILAAEIAHGGKTPIFIPSYTGKEVLFFYGAAAAMRILGVGLLALRLTSALAGLLTVAATAWLTYELFADDAPGRTGDCHNPGRARWLAALAATLLATSFWHLLLSRVGFRAVTQPLLQALTLAALWRGLRRDDLRWTALGGLLCGLTAYTYLAARAFPLPLAASSLALLLLDAGRRRRRLVQLGTFGLTALFSFTPLGLYFLRHPEAFTTRMGQVGPGGNWNAALEGTVAALKMLFWRGDPYVRFNLPFRPLFDPVVAVLFVVGLGVTVWRLFQPPETTKSPALSRAREILLLLWLPIMLLPTALAVNEITPSNLRAVGLIPLVFIFPARGLLRIAYCVLRITSCATRNTQYAIRLTSLLLLLGTGLTTARAYFYTYASRTDLYEASDGDLADVAAYLNTVDTTDTTLYVGSIHYRHPTLAFLADDYSRIKWLVGASTLVYPASGGALYLFPRSATPDAGWVDRHLPGASPVKAPPGPDGASAFTGYRLVASPELAQDPLANWGGVVRLLDYRVRQATSGGEADVTLTWQILAPPPHADLGPFYHLVDPWGSRWGQAEPFHYAAADWTPGEVVVDRVRAPVAPGAPPGEYLLQVGFYSQSADARQPIVDEAGRYSGTTTPLTLTVARAAAPPDPATLGIRQRLNQKLNGGLTLLGANLDTSSARPGERVHLTLFWQADVRPPDYHVHLFLQDVPGAELGLYSGPPVHGTYPTGRWTPGEVVVDRYNPRLPLAAADAPAGTYPLALSLTTPKGSRAMDPIPLGQLTLVATDRTFELPRIENAQRVTLANQVEFLGYDLDLSEAHPGGVIHLTLYWRPLSEIETDYTVFTHLLDPAGNLLAQQDNPPVNGTFPTTLWLPGEIVTDPYHIRLPPDLPPGDYVLETGLYMIENGLRLGDPILLDTVISISP